MCAYVIICLGQLCSGPCTRSIKKRSVPSNFLSLPLRLPELSACRLAVRRKVMWARAVAVSCHCIIEIHKTLGRPVLSRPVSVERCSVELSHLGRGWCLRPFVSLGRNLIKIFNTYPTVACV